jgi:hypothetical protein
MLQPTQQAAGLSYLDCHGLLGWVDHACACAVVEVDVRHLNALGQGVGVDGKVVVLSADLHTTCSPSTGTPQQCRPVSCAKQLN